MARLELACPRCGESLEVKTKVGAARPDGRTGRSVELAVRIRPCQAWCKLLSEAD